MHIENRREQDQFTYGNFKLVGTHHTTETTLHVWREQLPGSQCVWVWVATAQGNDAILAPDGYLVQFYTSPTKTTQELYGKRIADLEQSMLAWSAR